MNKEQQIEISNKLYDKKFRKTLINNSGKYFKDSKYNVKVVKNTKHTLYIVIPSSTVSEDDLTNIDAAGITLSVGTAATIGTLTSTAGTLGTASSAIIIT